MLKSVYPSALLVIAVLLNGIGPLPAQAKQAQPLLDAQNCANQSFQPDTRIGACTKALKLTPNEHKLWRYRAFAWMSKKSYDQAIADFSKAIALAPKSDDIAWYYASRGNAWFNKRAYEQATVDLTKAIELAQKLKDKDLDTYYSLRAYISMKKGKFEQGLDDLNKALELAPKFDFYYALRGRMWIKKQDYTKALSDFKRAIELAPSEVDAYFGLAFTYAFDKQYPQADETLSKILANFPEEKANVQAFQGCFYYLQGQTQQAQQTIEQAIPLIKEINIQGEWLDNHLPELLRNRQADAREVQAIQTLLIQAVEKEDKAALSAVYQRLLKLPLQQAGEPLPKQPTPTPS